MRPPEAEIFAAVRRVVTALRGLEVEYFIGGSRASTVFREPRLTIDTDVVARPGTCACARRGARPGV